MRGAWNTIVILGLCMGLLFAPGGAIASTPEQDAYAARFLLVNGKVVELGEDVGTAIATADRETNRQLARQFSSSRGVSDA